MHLGRCQEGNSAGSKQILLLYHKSNIFKTYFLGGFQEWQSSSFSRVSCSDIQRSNARRKKLLKCENFANFHFEHNSLWDEVQCRETGGCATGGLADALGREERKRVLKINLKLLLFSISHFSPPPGSPLGVLRCRVHIWRNPKSWLMAI